ncbi:hypothetical protein [Microbacterium stercoris]|uniref:Uncharacterized protein n=1 Tax=Microbacterium stercoris TaxID=2820289 RepID=A0A939TUL7_9MICO|nr:hypothetical protein [Microbacterium stercoris]MBO3664169.1 hypothetical protein [Microbacterium stercoris]
MSPDQLDELLDRSAPASQAADASDLDAMITAARFEAAPRRRPRSRAIAAGAVLTVLLLGGAGAAAATDGLDWAPWAQHPVGAVPFTMSNGFECELRFSEWTGGADPLFVARVNAARADWHRSNDMVAEVQAILPDVLEQLDETMVWSTMGDENGAGTEVIDEPVPTTPEEVQHRAWSRE